MKQYIRQRAKQLGVDPAAVLAVASTEGGFNGGASSIGDSGTSYGPFQLHWQGAMPKQYWGNATASQNFAWSKAGANYALDRIASVAAGKKGKAAVNAIVREFERPADPDSQVAKAISRLGQFGGGGGSVGRAPQETGFGGKRAEVYGQVMQQLSRFAQDGQLTGLDPVRLAMAETAQAEVPAVSGNAKARVSPLNTKLGPGSEFGIVDAEGAPSQDGNRYHAGKDWFAPPGSVVKAPWSGTVVEVRASKGNSGQVFGGTVKVRNKNGKVAVFRHVDPKGVKEGQKIGAGTKIATVTNWAGGPAHAHIEVWKTLGGGYNYENMIDPVNVFG